MCLQFAWRFARMRFDRMKKTACLIPFGALLLVALVSLHFNACGAADNWPQWRGLNRDGQSQSTGLLKQWPADGPALTWKTTGLGQGYSGVALDGSKIYTMGDSTNGCLALCLDAAASGKQLWSAPVGPSGGGGGYPGPRCTPTVNGSLVAVLGQDGDLVCLDAASGKVLWKHNLKSELGGKVMSGWGYSESPIIEGDLVVCSPGGAEGTIAAFDKKTGKLAWRTKDFTDPASYSSMVAATLGGVRQLIQLTGANVVGVSAADGKVLWRAPRAGRTAVIPTPIYSDGQVYVASGYGAGCNLFKITAKDSTFSAEQVYQNTAMVNHHGGVVRVGDYLYGFSDQKGWTCQDFKTGEVKWQVKDKLGKGSISYADGRLYLRAEGGPGTLVLIEASPEGFKECGRFNQPDRSNKNSWPHPVIAAGKLYIRDQDTLLCYDLSAPAK